MKTTKAIKAIGCVGVVLVLAVFLSAVGCGDKRVKKVEFGVAHVKHLLEKTKTDMLTGVAFNSTCEMGGNIGGFIGANTADPDLLPPLIMEGPPKPFSVVVRRGSSPGEFIIEGYKEDTNTPAYVENVKEAGKLGK